MSIDGNRLSDRSWVVGRWQMNRGDGIVSSGVQMVARENQVASSVGFDFPDDFVVGAVGSDEMVFFIGFCCVDNAVGQHRFIGHERCLESGFEIERARSLQTCVNIEPFIVGDDEGTAGSFTARVDFEVLLYSIAPLQHGRDGSAARNDEVFICGHQGTLRCNSCK